MRRSRACFHRWRVGDPGVNARRDWDDEIMIISPRIRIRIDSWKVRCQLTCLSLEEVVDLSSLILVQFSQLPDGRTLLPPFEPMIGRDSPDFADTMISVDFRRRHHGLGNARRRIKADSGLHRHHSYHNMREKTEISGTGDSEPSFPGPP